MEVGKLVMAYHGANIEGFPALLEEVMWRGNFSYRLEYAVYAKGYRHGMVDYMANVRLPSASPWLMKRLIG